MGNVLLPWVLCEKLVSIENVMLFVSTFKCHEWDFKYKTNSAHKWETIFAGTT